MQRPRKYTVSGRFMGKWISRPGFDTPYEARTYARMKGWHDIKAIRDEPVRD